MYIKTSIVLTALFLTACATSRPNLPELSPSSGRLSLDGASFAPPVGDGWYVIMQTPFHIGLVKPLVDEDETVAVEAQLFKFTGPVSEKDFAQQVKAGEDQNTDPKRFTTQVHEVTSVKIGQAICARSYFVTLDHAPHTHSHSDKPMILEALSLKCSHPDDPRVGVSVTYSERYYPGDVDPQFKTDAMAVLDSVELSKLKE
ncbi:MAG: hypothetical protein WBR15_03845 [Gammaproteobacteria bacterium]